MTEVIGSVLHPVDGLPNECVELMQLLLKGSGIKLDWLTWEPTHSWVTPPEPISAESDRLAQLLAREVYKAEKSKRWLRGPKPIDYVAYYDQGPVNRRLAYLLAQHLSRKFKRYVQVLRLSERRSKKQLKDGTEVMRLHWAVDGASIESIRKSRILFVADIGEQYHPIVRAMKTAASARNGIEFVGLAMLVKRDLGLRANIQRLVRRKVRLFYFFECDLEARTDRKHDPALSEHPDDNAFRRPKPPKVSENKNR